jgi:hypothetical protein
VSLDRLGRETSFEAAERQIGFEPSVVKEAKPLSATWVCITRSVPTFGGSLWSSLTSLPNPSPILAARRSPTVITFPTGIDEHSAAPSANLLHGSESTAPFNTSLAAVRRRALADDRDASRGVAEHVDDGGEATRGVGSRDAGGSKAYPRNKRECSSGCESARPHKAIEPRCPAFGSVPRYRRDREPVHNRARSKRRVAPRSVRSSM